MKTRTRTLLLIYTVLLPLFCMAQPDGFDDFGGDAQVPVDGGVIFVIAASVSYAAKKLHEERKKRQRAK